MRTFAEALCLCVSIALISVLSAAGCAHTERSRITLSRTSTAGSAYPYPLGQRLVYSLVYRNAASTDFTSLFRASKATPAPGAILAATYATRVDSRLQLTVVGYNGDLTVLDVRFLSPLVALQVDGEDQAASSSALQLDVAKPIVAEVSPGGRIAFVRFDGSVAPRAQTLVNTLLALTQFVTPRSLDNRGCTWQTTENDPNGAYLAEYAGMPCSLSGPARTYRTYTKKWVRYFSQPSEAYAYAKLPTIILPQGILRATLRRDSGLLESLNGGISQQIELSGYRVAASQTVLRYRLLTTQEAGSSDLDALSRVDSELLASTPMSLSSQPEAASVQAAVQNQVLGSDTADTLHQQVAALTTVARTHFPTQLYLKLKALFSLEPQSSDRFADVLNAGNPNETAFQILGLALGAVGTTQAQATLVDVLQKRSSDAQVVDVLLSDLVRAPQPTAETVTAVRSLAAKTSNQSIAGMAQLALGALARSLAATSPADADAIIVFLVQDENAAASQPDRINILLSLGNAGSMRALPAISVGLVDPSAAVRSAAVTALRWVPSPDADSALSRALTSDPDPEVRSSAALSLSFRSPTAGGFEAEHTAFARDSSDEVRIRALMDIWMARVSFPQARAIVRAAMKDQSNNVRRTATQLLAG
jgi:HEAT repeat protein